jgi:hypothetical protein
MKHNLENSIKGSLEKYEMPYDSNAWSKMNKRLDQSFPVSPKSNIKWFLGGAAALVAIFTTVALWPTDIAVTPEKQNATKQTASKSNDSEEISIPTIENQKSTVNEPTSKVAKSKEIFRNIEITTAVQEKNTISTVKETISNSQQIIQKGNQVNAEPKVSNSFVENNLPKKDIEITAIENSCFGEPISILNKNEINLILIDPIGTKSIIKSNNSLTYTPESEGKYTIGYLENGEFITIENFNILSIPKIDFSIDDQIKYENGLPTINLSTNSIGSSHIWSFESQKGTISGKDAKVHYFNKGEYSISLTVQGSNGCKASELKTVRVDDDYNLLAVTAFDPLSNDIRKSSFIPFALTQRTVDFNMIILDPKDGAIIFETNDTTNPWKGNDRRNGQLIDANKTYIWRVTIENPEKGEKSEYKGTILRL